MHRINTVEGIDELEQLLKHMDDRQKYLDSRNGQVIDPKQDRSVIFGGPFLHEGTESITEQESAEFERDSPETFKQLRKLKQDLFDTLK